MLTGALGFAGGRFGSGYIPWETNSSSSSVTGSSNVAGQIGTPQRVQNLPRSIVRSDVARRGFGRIHRVPWQEPIVAV